MCRNCWSWGRAGTGDPQGDFCSCHPAALSRSHGWPLSFPSLAFFVTRWFGVRCKSACPHSRLTSCQAFLSPHRGHTGHRWQSRDGGSAGRGGSEVTRFTFFSACHLALSSVPKEEGEGISVRVCLWSASVWAVGAFTAPPFPVTSLILVLAFKRGFLSWQRANAFLQRVLQNRDGER